MQSQAGVQKQPRSNITVYWNINFETFHSSLLDRENQSDKFILIVTGFNKLQTWRMLELIVWSKHGRNTTHLDESNPGSL